MKMVKVFLLGVAVLTINLASQVSAEVSVEPGYKAEVFAAGLEIPKALTMNGNDELFVIESGKYRILKIQPDGTVSVFAENGPGAPLDFHSHYLPTYPTKMAFDDSGNLFAEAVGGYYNPYNRYGDVLDTLYRIAPDGTVNAVARQWFYPNIFFDIAALAFGPDGSLYMGETWYPNDILKVDLETGTSTKFARNIANPTDFVFDKAGNLYACLRDIFVGKQNIYIISPDGTRSLFTDQFPAPIAIAWGPEGHLYVLDGSSKSIFKIDPATKDLSTIATGFHYPIDIEFDSKGNLFVAEPCLGDLSLRTNPTPACYGQIVKISKANEPPIAEAGDDQTVEMTSCAGAEVILDGAASTDPDGDTLTYTWSWPGGSTSGSNATVSLPYGSTTVTLTVDDGMGGTDSDTATINVSDTVAPALSVTLSPDNLWPPNHKYVEILPFALAEDVCGEATNLELLSVTSNEPDNGLGDGDTAKDIVINADGSISLRAERSGKGSGRVYTVTYQATDVAGNSTVSSGTVTVPHNKQQ